MRRHDLYHFMKSLRRDLEQDYLRIKKRTAEDPGTAGDEVEESWAELLRNWLPPQYHVVTKGRIVNTRGEASPQVDVLVLRPEYPKALMNKKVYLAGGTAAAFECKLALQSRHLDKIFRNAHEIKNLIEPRRGNPYDELHQPIIYGVLSHSHGWSKKTDLTQFRILESINKYELNYCDFPKEQANIFCVADTATYMLSQRVLVENNLSEEEKHEIFGNEPPFEGVHSGYFCQWEEDDKPYLGTNLGALLCYLLQHLAFEDPSLRPVADYFAKTDITSGMMGIPSLWKPSVLTEQTMEQLRDSGFEDDSWSKWQEAF